MTIRLSARARAHVDRAKRCGARFETFEPEEVFVRDDYQCMAGVGELCPCGQKASTDVAFPHPDFATLGHFPALDNGGTHFRSTTFTQRWACNQQQNHSVDAPTRAKWRRQARETGPQSDKARAGKRKIESPGFRGSRGFGGALRFRDRNR